MAKRKKPTPPTLETAINDITRDPAYDTIRDEAKRLAQDAMASLSRKKWIDPRGTLLKGTGGDTDAGSEDKCPTGNEPTESV